MSKLRRFFEPRRTYFITCVTFDRLPILVDYADLLLGAIRFVRTKHRFGVAAWVIQPDHLHVLMRCINGNPDTVIHSIKQKFSAFYRSQHQIRQGRLWQHRYWDHVIRDAGDFERHMNYIHYNPVKHGLVANPFDYRYSSLKWFADRGYYGPDWGRAEPDSMEGDFGE